MSANYKILQKKYDKTRSNEIYWKEIVSGKTLADLKRKLSLFSFRRD